MRRGRGKGKKQSSMAAHEDAGSGEEERIPASKRRGRPTRPPKDEIEEEDEEELEKAEKELEEANELLLKKKKRRPISSKGTSSMKEDIGMEAKLDLEDSTRFVGYRQNGSRRKNKPRRAAEVGVECN